MDQYACIELSMIKCYEISIKKKKNAYFFCVFSTHKHKIRLKFFSIERKIGMAFKGKLKKHDNFLCCY